MSGRLTKAGLLAALSLGAIVGSAVANAQQPTVRDTRKQAEADAPADRFGFLEGQQLQVSTGTDDKNLTFRVALPTGASMAHRFSLAVATPVQGDDDAMPASLDALANGSRVTLSFGHFPLRVNRSSGESRRIGDDARRTCLQEEAQEGTPEEIEAARRRCAVSTYAIYHHDDANWMRYLGLTSLGVTDWGIDATVGINNFEWVDPVTFGPQTARRTDWSLAGHLTHYRPARLLAFTFSASYQRAYKAADEQLLCPPNATDPATQCRTARGAGPSRDENLLLSAGFRYRPVSANGNPGPFAISPLITYEAIDDVWGVDVPIYIVPGENNALTGGVRLGYRSDRDDEFSISFFVGTTFNFFGGGS